MSSLHFTTVLVFLGNRTGSSYLKVAHHDESSGTDPACGETRCVENTVLVLLNDVGIAKQHDHHNYRKRGTEAKTQSQQSTMHVGYFTVPGFYVIQTLVHLV